VRQDVEINKIIDGCRRQERASQYQLHGLFYNYAMSVARRYAGGAEAAEEVVNDAFFKVFTKIEQYVPTERGNFKAWLRRVVINTAIDRLRSDLRMPGTEEWTSHAHDSEADSGILENLTLAQILGLLDHLPPAYRTVFNLHVADGCTHEEIGELLGITVGTSKSNLARARQHLRRLLAKDFAIAFRV
jgi:RNA polymerase sigma-70 factor (ECF subfamily)